MKNNDDEGPPKWLEFWVFGKLTTFGFGWLIGGILCLILRKDLLILGIGFIISGFGYIALMVCLGLSRKKFHERSKLKKIKIVCYICDSVLESNNLKQCPICGTVFPLTGKSKE